MIRGDNGPRPAPAYSPPSGRCRERVRPVKVATRIPNPGADGCASWEGPDGEEAGLAEVIRYDFPGGGAAQRPVASAAVLNLGPEAGDPEGNLLLAGRAIAGAKRECPSLRWVVPPELFTCGYSALESVHRSAEDAERGGSARFLRALARELGVFIAYGFPERARLGCRLRQREPRRARGGPRDLPQAQPREDDARALRLRGRNAAAGRRGRGVRVSLVVC